MNHLKRRLLRRRTGLTQTEMGHLVGRTIASIHRYEAEGSAEPNGLAAQIYYALDRIDRNAHSLAPVAVAMRSEGKGYASNLRALCWVLTKNIEVQDFLESNGMPF